MRLSSLLAPKVAAPDNLRAAEAAYAICASAVQSVCQLLVPRWTCSIKKWSTTAVSYNAAAGKSCG